MPRDGAPDPRSGLNERGEWSPAFPGQRPPLMPGHEHRVGEGNTLATQHGGYSLVALRPRAAALADQLFASLPDQVRQPRFRAMCELAASALARHEAAANAAADATDPDRAARLDVEASRWWKHAHAALRELALTPAALAALGVDVAAAERDRARAEMLERGRQIREQRAATIAATDEEARS